MTEKPEYMFPELQGLPDEFRRLAAEAEAKKELWDSKDSYHVSTLYSGQAQAFRQAAQMLEERLNG